jgi:flagellar motor switch protein FliN/FliY
MTETSQLDEQKEQLENAPAEAASKTQVKSVNLTEAPVLGTPDGEHPTAAAKGSIDVLLDFFIPVSVTIGTADISVRRLLQLAPGSVVKLDKPVDAPVDLYLKGKKFATGDVVVVDDKFAVRISQILDVSSQAEKENGEQS